MNINEKMVKMLNEKELDLTVLDLKQLDKILGGAASSGGPTSASQDASGQ